MPRPKQAQLLGQSHLAEVAEVVLSDKVGRRPPHGLKVQRARQHALLRVHLRLLCILRGPLLHILLLLLRLRCLRRLLCLLLLLLCLGSGWLNAGRVSDQVLVFSKLS